MWDFLKNLKQFLSLDYRSLSIVAGVLWIIILIPSDIWQSLGIFNLLSLLRPWIFVIALIASIWLIFGGLYDLIIIGVNKWKIWYKSQQWQRDNEKLMLSTSKVEREILKRFITEDTTTIAFHISDGIVNGLIAKNLLYRASQTTNPLSYDLDTNIQPWALEYLKKHPDILSGVETLSSGRHQIRF